MKFHTLILASLISISVQAQHAEIFQHQNGLFGYKNAKDSLLIPAKFSYSFPFQSSYSLVIFEGKYGFIDSLGQVAVTPQFDGAWSFEGNLAKVCQGCAFNFDAGAMEGGKWGYINTQGKIIIPLSYLYLGNFSTSDLATAQSEEKKWGFVNKEGKLAIPAIYEELRSFSGGLASISKNGKWGFIDPTGTEVIPAIYQKAGVFSEELAGVQINGKWGFVNTTGKVVIQPVYDEVSGFENGKTIVRLNQKFGIINNQGNTIAKTEYDEITNFKNGMARVRQGTFEKPKYGFMNTEGKLVIPANYDRVSGFSHSGLAMVKQGNNFSFLNRMGQPLGGQGNLSFEDATEFRQGFSQVKKDGKWGLLNESGEYQLAPQYDAIIDVKADGTIQVRQGNKTFLVDMKGNRLDGAKSEEKEKDASKLTAKRIQKRLGNAVFDWVGEKQVELDLYKINHEDKWGYADASGQIIIPLKYDGLEDFDSAGLARACIHCEYDIRIDEKGNSYEAWRGGTWGLVDTNGNELLPPDFISIQPYRGNELLVTKDGNWGIFDLKKGWIMQPKYQWIDSWEDSSIYIRVQRDDKWFIYDSNWVSSDTEFDELGYLDMPFVRAKKGGKWGFISPTGKTIIPFEYEAALSFSENRFPVYQNGKWGFLNQDGKLSIPFDYDAVEVFYEGKSFVKQGEEEFFIGLGGERLDDE